MHFAKPGKSQNTLLAMLATAGLLLPTTGRLWAADGDLDLTFDGDGQASVQVSAGFDDVVQDLILLPDGSALLAGLMHYSATDTDFAITRLTPSGSLDRQFGNNGHTTVAFDLGGQLKDFAMAVARQSDGKLVVAGYVEVGPPNNYDFAVTRLLANGGLDTGFGNAGRVTVAFDLGGTNFDAVDDVLIQADGKIVVLGTAARSGDDKDIVAVRLLPSGAIDTSFGFQGKTVAYFDLGGSNRDQAEAALLQTDGKILVAGTVERSNLNFDFVVTRWLANGLVDTSFGNQGKTIVPFDRGGSDQDFARAMAFDRFGNILVSGHSSDATGPDFAVARLLPNGSLDSSFSTGGKLTIGLGLGIGHEQAYAVAAAPNGQIILAGTAWISSTDADFATVRLNHNGTLDSRFGNNGRAMVAFDIAGDKTDRLRAMAIGLDGGITLAGSVSTIHGLTLTGVARLIGAPWFILP